MPITFECACGKKLRVKDEHAGKKVKCPGCGQALSVPASESEELEAPTPAANELSDGAGWGGMEDAPPPPRPRKAAVKKQAMPASAPGNSGRDYLYWVLLLALLPLVVHIIASEHADLKGRVISTVERVMTEAPPEVTERVANALEKSQFALSDLLDALPDGKLDGAHLSVHSWMHWLYALLTAAAFLGLTLALFPSSDIQAYELLLVGLFTATIGILLLLAVQVIAGFTDGILLRGGNIVVVIFYVFKFVGFSYRAALDPESGFLLSLFGFTFGVGLCEELCKALPLIRHFRRRPVLDWRGAMLWGLATGFGFGIGESIHYASDFYNGISTYGIYLVRYISCVALHGIWSAAIGITIYQERDWFLGDMDWGEYAHSLLRVLWMPMILHGLYDTLLKKDMDGGALAVALASFAWLAWKVERARRSAEEEPKPRRKRRALPEPG